MATARERTQVAPVVAGSATRKYDGHTVHSSYVPVTKSMLDVVGNPFGDNPLNALSVTKTGQTLNSDYDGGVFERLKYSAVNYPTGWPQLLSHDPATSSPDPDAIEQAYAMKVTNPSNPYVDLPVTITELVMLPKLLFALGIKELGKENPKKKKGLPTHLASISEDYLTWTFGWAPLIGDIVKMLEFTDKVDKRISALNKLSESGLHRSITTWEDETEERRLQSNDIPFTSLYGNVVYGYVTRQTTRRQWISVRWDPNPIYWKSSPDTRKLAYRLVMGLNISPATIWELMPWSWLIDWFTNLGDRLGAARGSTIATPGSVCRMIETRTREKCVWTSRPAGTSVSGGTGERVNKVRTPLVPSVPMQAYLPILTGKQVSILSALAIIRKFG